MSAVLVKIKPWEDSYILEHDLDFRAGDVIVAETDEGNEAAIVEETIEDEKLKKILREERKRAKFVRKANLKDFNALKEFKKKEKEVLKTCRQEVRKNNLPMKVVGCAYSLEGGSITFAFIAEGRVDFRDLVKNLSRMFQRSIRLHQIGARDEAKERGGYGICGRELCCVRFKRNLPSISSDMAKAQKIISRGSERISGICGRLMCCLAFEADQYRELLEKMPEIGSDIRTKEASGKVRAVNALTGEIQIELSDGSIAKVKMEDL